MSHSRTRVGVTFTLIAFILLALALSISPARAVTEHCPDHEGNPGKVNSVNPGDLDDVVLDEGTLFCVKSSTEATGLLEADGEQSLCDYLFAAGIVDGSGETCSNVSYYIVYETVPTPTPTPEEPTPTPTPDGSVPDIGLFSVATCPTTGEPLAVPAGQSSIRFEHPLLALLLLTVRVDGQIVDLADTLGDGTVGELIVTPGLHTWSISNAADTEVLAEGEIDCPECNPTTASVPGSVPDTALALLGSGAPWITVIFTVILLASLGALAYANVASVRRR